MNSNAQMEKVLREISSQNWSYAQMLTSYLEKSGDLAELSGLVAEMAAGSKDKTLAGMLLYLLNAKMSPMPPNLTPQEMFSILNNTFSERTSVGDHYGPEG